MQPHKNRLCLCGVVCCLLLFLAGCTVRSSETPPDPSSQVQEHALGESLAQEGDLVLRRLIETARTKKAGGCSRSRLAGRSSWSAA
jgi:hypothetical protein